MATEDGGVAASPRLAIWASMALGSLDAVVLDTIAAFAGALVDPLVLGAVLLATFSIARVGVARAAGAAIGLAHGLLDLVLADRSAAVLPTILGSIGAAALLAELVLQVVLPLLRLARRLLGAALGLIARLR